MNKLNFNVQILGEMATGKTSILNRFFNNAFNESYITTVGISLYTKAIQLTNLEIGLKVFDTCSQERFHSLPLNNVRKCQGLIIVYDATNKPSFDKIETWITKLSNVISLEECQLVLVGNKSDLQSVVSEDNVKELVKKYNNINLDYFFISAKTNINITESFLCLIKKMLIAHGVEFDEEELNNNFLTSKPLGNIEQMNQEGSKGIKLNANLTKKKKKKCC